MLSETNPFSQKKQIYPVARRTGGGKPNKKAFPCLELAFQAGKIGETAPAWLNAANEIAVEAFLEISEELVRGGRTLPNESWIIDASNQSKTWHQLMILLLSIDETHAENHLALIETAAKGGELFERIRNRLLQRIS